MQQRIISNDVFSFAISLEKKEFPSPLHQVGETRANKVDTIVALNIFDPDRTPKTAAGSRRPAVPRGTNSPRPNKAETSAADPERQLDDAQKTRAELESLLRTLEQTPGVTKEQTELLRQRLEHSEQQIERLQEQLKALRP